MVLVYCKCLQPLLAHRAQVRFVTIAGEKCPCGGTHVENVADLGVLTVTKLRAKGKSLKVLYEVK